MIESRIASLRDLWYICRRKVAVGITYEACRKLAESMVNL